jgi:arginine/ornithine N-succinyltransferase beta subunit
MSPIEQATVAMVAAERARVKAHGELKRLYAEHASLTKRCEQAQKSWEESSKQADAARTALITALKDQEGVPVADVPAPQPLIAPVAEAMPEPQPGNGGGEYGGGHGGKRRRHD